MACGLNVEEVFKVITTSNIDNIHLRNGSVNLRTGGHTMIFSRCSPATRRDGVLFRANR
jgi:hypothetical protein